MAVTVAVGWAVWMAEMAAALVEEVLTVAEMAAVREVAPEGVVVEVKEAAEMAVATEAVATEVVVMAAAEMEAEAVEEAVAMAEEEMAEAPGGTGESTPRLSCGSSAMRSSSSSNGADLDDPEKKHAIATKA